MTAAMDRASCSRAGWAVLSLLIVLAPGCARVESFRRPRDNPAERLAKLDAARDPAAPAPSRGADAYTEWLASGGDPAATDHASGTQVRSTQTPRDARASSSSGPVAVALGDPEPIQPEDDSRTADTPVRPAPAGSIALAMPAPAALEPLPNVEVHVGPMPEVKVTGPIVAPAATAGSKPAATDTDPLATFRKVVAETEAKVQSLQSYQCRMDRQERVGDILQDPENMLLSIRREPFAVRLEWTDGPSQGREVLYNAGGTMNVKMANPLLPRMSLPPDSPLALRNSRHPISEAGIGTVVHELEQSLARHDQAPNGPDKLAYGGTEIPAPGAPTCHKLERITPTRERWLVYVDTSSNLPYMVLATDPNGQLLERYVFRNIKTDLPELASNQAFDADARWGQQSGLLGRLARGITDPATDSATVR